MENNNNNQPTVEKKPVKESSSSVSIASLICGIISFCCCNPLYLVSIAAIVTGAVGLSKKPLLGSSKGFSIAGICLGAASIIICVIVDICLIPFTFGASFFF